MLKKSNVCKIFSLMTVILIMVSMILPMTVFAGVNDLVDLDPTKSNIKTVGFSDTGITGQAIVDEMNGATSTTEYVSGKVFFKAGKLGVETKGKTYTFSISNDSFLNLNLSLDLKSDFVFVSYL